MKFIFLVANLQSLRGHANSLNFGLGYIISQNSKTHYKSCKVSFVSANWFVSWLHRRKGSCQSYKFSRIL